MAVGAYPAQHVVGGCIALRDGTPLPMSAYTSECVRLMTEAMSMGDFDKLDGQWIMRRIKRDIVTQYGHSCWRCKKTIMMHWKGQPHHGELQESDRVDTRAAYFHTECWKI